MQSDLRLTLKLITYGNRSRKFPSGNVSTSFKQYLQTIMIVQEWQERRVGGEESGS